MSLDQPGSRPVPRTEHEINFPSACAVLESALAGNLRGAILDELVSKSKNLRDALQRLRGAVNAHTFRLGPNPLMLAKIVTQFDRRTVQDGFHVLRDWDGKADKLLDELIPLDLLDLMIANLPVEELQSRVDQRGHMVLSILMDYYLLYVLALFAMRVGDEGDPSANIQR